MSVFLSSNLQCLINLMLKFSVSQYVPQKCNKNDYTYYLIENNESFVKKNTFDKKKRLTKKKKKNLVG